MITGMALPDTIEPYPQISSKSYEHPADRAATAALKAIPMLDTVVRKLIEWQYERALRQMYLSNSVRVGEQQLPDLWSHHVAVCKILDMPRTYDLYVTDTVTANAMAIGSQNPIVVAGSPLLARLGPGEQRVVLAHEVGHILSDHVLYTTALAILLRAGGGVPFPLAIPAMAVRAVLLEWARAAELSCDRAAALVVRDPEDRLPQPDGAGRRHARRPAQPRRLPDAGARIRGLGRSLSTGCADSSTRSTPPIHTPSGAFPR